MNEALSRRLSQVLVLEQKNDMAKNLQSSLIEGFFSGSLRRGGLPLWPHEVFYLRYENEALTASPFAATIYTVPTNKVLVVHNVACLTAGDPTIRYWLDIGTTDQEPGFWGALTTASGQLNHSTTFALLTGGQVLRINVVGHVANDDIYMTVSGFLINLEA